MVLQLLCVQVEGELLPRILKSPNFEPKPAKLKTTSKPLKKRRTVSLTKHFFAALTQLLSEKQLKEVKPKINPINTRLLV